MGLLEQSSDPKPRASREIGPRDGRKAFKRIQVILDKLDLNVKNDVVKAITQYVEIDQGLSVSDPLHTDHD